MEEEKFYTVVKNVKGICHIALVPPDYPSDDLVIKFLDGPLAEMFAVIGNFDLKEEW